MRAALEHMSEGTSCPGLEIARLTTDQKLELA